MDGTKWTIYMRLRGSRGQSEEELKEGEYGMMLINVNDVKAIFTYNILKIK